MLLFGIPHLLLVELDDDGAELKYLPQQRVLRQLDVYAGPERLNEKRRKYDARNHYSVLKNRKRVISIGRKMLEGASIYDLRNSFRIYGPPSPLSRTEIS